MRLSPARRAPVEQALARGLGDADAAVETGHDVDTVRQVRAALDKLGGDNVERVYRPKRTAVEFVRPLETYGGAADPRLLAELVDAICPPQRVAKCGTRSGYNRHRRRGEFIDEACREAQRLRDERRDSPPGRQLDRRAS